jgi:hypothetical protein
LLIYNKKSVVHAKDIIKRAKRIGSQIKAKKTFRLEYFKNFFRNEVDEPKEVK